MSLKTLLKLPLTMALGLGMASASARAASVTQFITDVDHTMTQLGAPLEMTPDEVVYLNQAAMQLDDSRTNKPYETMAHHPLPYYVVDAAGAATAVRKRTVLFIGGIHADEVNPMVSSWRALLDLEQKKQSLSPGIRLIYAPLTNPDGFLTSTQQHGSPTRDNLHGVDLNRNFMHGNPEQETRFIMDLIRNFKPDAIISLHAPYGWLDYDGPARAPGASAEMVQNVNNWLDSIRAAAGTNLPNNSDFSTYRGSLGEYAGSTLKIHTLTFEYPGKEGIHGDEDWKLFGPALLKSLDLPF